MLLLLWWLTQWLSELRVPPYPPSQTPPHPSSCLPHPQPLPSPFPSSSPKFLLVLSRELCVGYWHARWMAVMWVATVLWHEDAAGLRQKRPVWKRERQREGKKGKREKKTAGERRRRAFVDDKRMGKWTFLVCLLAQLQLYGIFFSWIISSSREENSLNSSSAFLCQVTHCTCHCIFRSCIPPPQHTFPPAVVLYVINL